MPQQMKNHDKLHEFSFTHSKVTIHNLLIWCNTFKPTTNLYHKHTKVFAKKCYNTWKQQNVYAIGSHSKGRNKVQHQSIINQMHHKMNILQLNTRVQVHQKLKTAYAKMQKCISQYQKHDHKLYMQWWYQEGWDFHTSRLLNNRVIKASLKATTRFVLNLKVTSLKAIKVIHWSFFSLMTICWKFWS
jgi:hypothetical protein